MEIKATLNKPYTEEERIEFIVEYNHNQGLVIEESETELKALGYTEEAGGYEQGGAERGCRHCPRARHSRADQRAAL